MPKVTFEVTSYEIKMARELTATAGDVPLSFPAHITCSGDGGYVTIYFLHDASQSSPNYWHGANRGTIFMPRWQYDWVVDILRNEKPVYCTLSSDNPKWHSLHTGPEPPGDGEQL